MLPGLAEEMIVLPAVGFAPAVGVGVLAGTVGVGVSASGVGVIPIVGVAFTGVGVGARPELVLGDVGTAVAVATTVVAF